MDWAATCFSEYVPRAIIRPDQVSVPAKCKSTQTNCPAFLRIMNCLESNASVIYLIGALVLSAQLT